jgi:2-polyprenyl-3-methyl-5-hydroxy-6-metoxy-1,4-benzoquinol methylase
MNRDTERWNHNIHYIPLVLGAVRPGAENALDVGCGEGTLVRRLRELLGNVTGIDPDGESLTAARRVRSAAGIEYIRDDFLDYPFAPGSFDFVSCVAALHHMDEVAALERIRDLLRPGGSLAVIGLARSRLPRDLPWEISGAVATRVHKLTKNYWDHPSPTVWPPPHTYGEVAHLSQAVLPGRYFRRLVLWRYLITWTKPVS